MSGGYVGKILFVNLSNRELKVEEPGTKFYRDFLGGYGIGARILFSHQKAHVDPLGPDNILGFATGMLTGTPAPFGCRYTVVAKSPLTGTFGDANSGGDFGPNLKFSGYDAVFFTGASDRPVYLLVDNGKAEIRSAQHIWGKDTAATENILHSEIGEDRHVACIGPAGEKLSLISAIVNNKGRAAARSGLGAVMGSKKLKAIVVRGNTEVPVANPGQVRELRRKYLAELVNPAVNDLRKYGTVRSVHLQVQSGDAPVKNWGGGGTADFPNAIAVSRDNAVKNQGWRFACWHCPIGCGGLLKEGTGTYKYAAGSHRPEYETVASFGPMCLNDDMESICKANEICNLYGLDTISAGCTIAFAIECYENGLISLKDTDGVALNWGNHTSIVKMTEKLARRQGFGEILADGVKVACEKIGKGSEQFAVHIGGQEPGMHDPKLAERWAISYKIDATPGKHMQGWENFAPQDILPSKEEVGERHKIASSFIHAANAAGLCLIGALRLGSTSGFVPDFISAVTGWDASMAEILESGERISNIRQAFNIREGINSVERRVPGRFLGNPPQQQGPLAGRTINLDPMIQEYLKSADWDGSSGKPSLKKLRELQLEDVARDI